LYYVQEGLEGPNFGMIFLLPKNDNDRNDPLKQKDRALIIKEPERKKGLNM